MGWEFAIKHGFDRTVAAVGLLVLSPVIGIIALAVKLTSPGPVLFRQRRVGRDGQVFDVLKFRSMRTGDAELGPAAARGPTRRRAASRATDRRTRGRAVPAPHRRWTSCRSCFNVLRGDMSLVGPRPRAARAASAASRERVRPLRRPPPGQVRASPAGRRSTACAARPRSPTASSSDNYYIENWSLWLDLKILLMTVPTVFTSPSGRASRRSSSGTARSRCR